VENVAVFERTCVGSPALHGCRLQGHQLAFVASLQILRFENRRPEASLRSALFVRRAYRHHISPPNRPSCLRQIHSVYSNAPDRQATKHLPNEGRMRQIHVPHRVSLPRKPQKHSANTPSALEGLLSAIGSGTVAFAATAPTQVGKGTRGAGMITACTRGVRIASGWTRRVPRCSDILGLHMQLDGSGKLRIAWPGGSVMSSTVEAGKVSGLAC